MIAYLFIYFILYVFVRSELLFQIFVLVVLCCENEQALNGTGNKKKEKEEKKI